MLCGAFHSANGAVSVKLKQKHEKKNQFLNSVISASIFDLAATSYLSRMYCTE